MTGLPGRQAPDWLSSWTETHAKQVEDSKERLLERDRESRAHAALRLLRERGHLDEVKKGS